MGMIEYRMYIMHTVLCRLMNAISVSRPFGHCLVKLEILFLARYEMINVERNFMTIGTKMYEKCIS